MGLSQSLNSKSVAGGLTGTAISLSLGEAGRRCSSLLGSLRTQREVNQYKVCMQHILFEMAEEICLFFVPFFVIQFDTKLKEMNKSGHLKSCNDQMFGCFA